MTLSMPDELSLNPSQDAELPTLDCDIKQVLLKITEQ